MDKKLEEYLEFTRKELQKLIDNKFHGNISIQYNLKFGGISNSVVTLNKSFKPPEPSSL